ncbi:MAG: fumarylacetoacetate hydrolase family protein [Deltaproteobacteria bacterium]|nr:fumarylacetoacetate hydrolase family protein [Deltaproteobacteria bacterium]
MITLPIKNRNTSYVIQPSKVIALGLNYRDHIAESGSLDIKGLSADIPTEPILFTKTPNCLIGPDEPIVLPQFVHTYGFTEIRNDYEAELAFIVKDRCKHISATAAMDHILGFTCFNDVSQRNIQRLDTSGWFRAKSFDTFGPIGPSITLPEDLGDPQNLTIRCRLNGTVVQESNTRYMIFGVPQILSFISKQFTLLSGDVIVTGTPSGVGPLEHGDVVEVEIENIGVLRNPVIDESLR